MDKTVYPSRKRPFWNIFCKHTVSL
jgi:hypothetical protein